VEALAVPITFEGNLVRISASVGVCSAPAGLLDAETLLKCADAALYHAKASGRNRFQAFITDMAVEKKQIAS
jgi:diguanylate cyclase (GGDEF)-like protein